GARGFGPPGARVAAGAGGGGCATVGSPFSCRGRGPIPAWTWRSRRRRGPARRPRSAPSSATDLGQQREQGVPHHRPLSASDQRFEGELTLHGETPPALLHEADERGRLHLGGWGERAGRAARAGLDPFAS